MREVVLLAPSSTWSIRIRSRRRRLRVDCRAHASGDVAAYVLEPCDFQAFSADAPCHVVSGHAARARHHYAVELDKEEVVYFVVRNPHASDVALWVSVA